MTPLRISILTLFPDYFTGIFSQSILKRAHENHFVRYEVIHLRQFATDTHSTTDDRPYGGGPGMVMMVEPIDKALQHLGVRKGQSGTAIVLTSAKGKLFDQKTAQNWSKLSHIVLICGHYEGVDERVALHLVDAEVRIGDFVLTGGEAAAAVMVDSVVRLVPGVLGNEASTQGESHSQPGLLAHPQYTRPEVYKGWTVPKILLSGDHQLITAWRVSQRISEG